MNPRTSCFSVSLVLAMALVTTACSKAQFKNRPANAVLMQSVMGNGEIEPQIDQADDPAGEINQTQMPTAEASEAPPSAENLDDMAGMLAQLGNLGSAAGSLPQDQTQMPTADTSETLPSLGNLNDMAGMLAQLGNLGSAAGSMPQPVSSDSAQAIFDSIDFSSTDFSSIDFSSIDLADPLVLHVGKSPSSIALSDRAHGVYFDLLGRRTAHRPVRISWFTNNEYGLLALPDAKGEVRGIDQLFGDSTFGPDRRFARDGYHALSKYDANTDKVINMKDAVYSRLRVWVDRDRNAIAHASELLTLKEAGIEFISLDYTDDYREQDAYGNIATRKAVTGRSDGTLDIIFDLWFNYSR